VKAVDEYFSKVLLRVEVSWMGIYEDTRLGAFWGFGNMRVFEVFYVMGKNPVRSMKV